MLQADRLCQSNGLGPLFQNDRLHSVNPALAKGVVNSVSTESNYRPGVVFQSNAAIGHQPPASNPIFLAIKAQDHCGLAVLQNRPGGALRGEQRAGDLVRLKVAHQGANRPPVPLAQMMSDRYAVQQGERNDHTGPSDS